MSVPKAIWLSKCPKSLLAGPFMDEGTHTGTSLIAVKRIAATTAQGTTSHRWQARVRRIHDGPCRATADSEFIEPLRSKDRVQDRRANTVLWPSHASRYLLCHRPSRCAPLGGLLSGEMIARSLYLIHHALLRLHYTEPVQTLRHALLSYTRAYRRLSTVIAQPAFLGGVLETRTTHQHPGH
jgi:hypothetical protein